MDCACESPEEDQRGRIAFLIIFRSRTHASSSVECTQTIYAGLYCGTVQGTMLLLDYTFLESVTKSIVLLIEEKCSSLHCHRPLPEDA